MAGRAGSCWTPICELGAALAPAAFEACAVVGEHALDPDAVAAVEALQFIEEGDRGVGGLVRVDDARTRAGWRRRSRRTGTASLPCRARRRSVAGDAMAGHDDPAELLDVDVQELARPLTLVADDLPRSRLPPAASGHAGAGSRALSRRPGRAANRADAGRRATRHVLAAPPAQPRRRPPRRAMRPRRAIGQPLTAPSTADPLRRRLPRATHHRAPPP